jgi:hypothetical protein
MQESSVMKVTEGKKENKVARSSCRECVQSAVLRIPFEEFLSKGVWWMPRLKKAMKDAA